MSRQEIGARAPRLCPGTSHASTSAIWNTSHNGCCLDQTGSEGEPRGGGSGAMPNEEKDLLIAYLADAGELDPTATWRPSSWPGTKPGRRRCWARPTTRGRFW